MGIVDTVASIPTAANLSLQLKDAEAKIAAMEQEKNSADSSFRKEIGDLKSRLSQEKIKSATLEHQIKAIHSIYLNDKHQSVLVAVASKSGAETARIAEYAGLSEDETLEKLSYMEARHLILRGHNNRTIPDPDKPRGIQERFFTWTVLSLGHHCIISLGLQEKIT